MSKLVLDEPYVMCFIQDNPMENLNTAFDVAEKHLDIPRMLDAEGTFLTLAVFSHLGAAVRIKTIKELKWYFE